MIRELSVDSNGNPESAFVDGLLGRSVPFTQAQGQPSPVVAHSLAVRQLAASCRRFLDAFDDVVAARRLAELNDPQIAALTELFKQIIYRATEVFDFYAKLPDTLSGKRQRSLKASVRDYRDSVKRRRDHWALMCNRMKHNGNVIVPVCLEYEPAGPLMLGFGICSYQSDVLAPNREVHRSGKAIGYIAELHQLISDLIGCDLAAGRLIKAVDEDGSVPPHQGLPSALSIGKEATRIAALIPVGMGEARTQDVVVVSANSILTERRHLALPSPKARIHVCFEGDGVTRQFRVFV